MHSSNRLPHRNTRPGHHADWLKSLAKGGRWRSALIVSVLGAAAVLPLSESFAGTKPGTQLILTPHQARQQGLESLRSAVRQDGGVPQPRELSEFIKDRNAAVQLGKALFWDMQLGSDGVQACASCHFHAGADNRATSQFNPDRLTVVDARDGDVNGYFNARTIADLRFDTRQPNETVTREDFPLVKSIGLLARKSDGTIGPGAGNSNDIISSMGTFLTFFDGVQPGSPIDAGTPIVDSIWTVDGQNVRRVEPRNSPSVINAVFNFTNFWDGRANPYFNGNDSFGDQDPFVSVLVNRPGEGLTDEPISLDNASLASQAMTPPSSFTEMSFGNPSQGNFRELVEIGMKLLRPSPNGARLIPLGLQEVDRRDSVLGALSNAPGRGLSTTYEAMIKRAFADQYWNSAERIPFPTQSSDEFSQMEANFSLFFGLAVQLYEATLVSDQAPFDRWMETGRLNRGFGIGELAGLNLFANQGKCLSCHAGPEFTKASVRSAKAGNHGNTVISAMTMAKGAALYDIGFYNIGVTPTTDDIGRGSRDLFGMPLAFSRQALFDRLGIAGIDFPILGNDRIAARAEGSAEAVCEDLNANKLCDPDETLLPQFQRVAVDGAFKTPGLRNVELTGPYFHNGGVATLRQAVQFYNRGGNFCDFNRKELHPDIGPLDLTPLEERLLVGFLVSLTDERVKYRKAPFDHPELRVPDDGLATLGTRRIEAVGAQGAVQPLKPFLDLNPQDAIFTPSGQCSKE